MLTYGWAILIIVIVAAALWSFGVFNPSASTSSTSITGFSGIAVTTAEANSNLFAIYVTNTVGYTVNITGINVTFNGNTYSMFQCGSGGATFFTLAPQVSTTCEIAGSFPSPVSASVSIGYTVLNGLDPYTISQGIIRTPASQSNKIAPILGLFIYAVGSSSTTGITTINPATNNIVYNSTPKIGSNQGIAITPDAKVAYVSTNSTSVAFVNLTSGSLISSINTGSTPFTIAIAPNGKLAYVVNYGSHSLSVINTTTRGDIKNISGGLPRPVGVAVSPDLKFVYVTNQAPSVLSIVNTTSLTIIRNVTSLPANAQSVAVTANGKLAYVACQTTPGKVAVINLTSYTDIKNITVGPQAWTIVIAPNGKLAYVSDNNGAEITVINMTSNSDIKNITVGSGPQGMAITSDSRFIYVANPGSNTISVINAATSSIVTTISGGFAPIAMASGPQGTA